MGRGRKQQSWIERVALSVALAPGAEPPAEIRIFKRGWNETSKGNFLFDAEAARTVMAEFERHGADGMIDLEHLSLDQKSTHYDPDARGWYRLEIRDGECWLVRMSWTPDGETRLREKRQRYLSPFFAADRTTKRIVKLVNVAIVGMPATHEPEPLVAASERHAMADQPASEVDIAKVAEGMGLDLESIAKALGLESGASLEDLAASVDALGSKLKAIAGLGSPPAEEPAPDAAAANAQPTEEQKQMTALRDALLRETNESTPMLALSQVTTWKASHLALEQGKKKLEDERIALEKGERKALAAELVKLGKETSHTSGLAYNKLAKHLADMPIADLRDRVAQFRRTPGASTTQTVAASSAANVFNVNGHQVELDAREIQICAEMKCEPAVFAARKYPNGRTAA